MPKLVYPHYVVSIFSIIGSQHLRYQVGEIRTEPAVIFRILVILTYLT